MKGRINVSVEIPTSKGTVKVFSEGEEYRGGALAIVRRLMNRVLDSIRADGYLERK